MEAGKRYNYFFQGYDASFLPCNLSSLFADVTPALNEQNLLCSYSILKLLHYFVSLTLCELDMILSVLLCAKTNK